MEAAVLLLSHRPHAGLACGNIQSAALAHRVGALLVRQDGALPEQAVQDGG